MKNLVIETGGNKTLNKIVQELLFALGANWRGSYGKLVLHSNAAAISVQNSILEYVTTPLWYKNNHPYSRFPSFDAATEMGKLIEFLEKKETEIDNVAVGNNRRYNGIISPDGKFIEVG